MNNVVVFTSSKSSTQEEELPNDSGAVGGPPGTSEAWIPSARLLFEYDAPGSVHYFVQNQIGNYAQDVDFREWVRVTFDGNQPEFNQVVGSRASHKFGWWHKMSLINVGGYLQRATSMNGIGPAE